MSALRLLLASLAHHWRINLAVGLGVAAGTAVLTGALLVGDSVRGSLRQLTLDRLGRIDEALVVSHFFRAELADELAAQSDFKESFEAAVPVILLSGSISQPDRGARVNGATLIGCDARFWKLDPLGAVAVPDPNQVVLNAPLAEELGVKVGDDCIVRMPTQREVPADSPLGRKTENVTNRRLTVSAIVPAEGLGRFSLQPNQRFPLNVYLNAATVQRALEQPGHVNALLVAGRGELRPQRLALAHDRLQAMLQPKPIDYGLKVVPNKLGHFDLSSQRMLLEPAIEKATSAAYASLESQPVFTFLATTLACGEKDIPYSTITAIDFAEKPPLGPFLTPKGAVIAPLADDEIALNQWAAEDLGVWDAQRQQMAPNAAIGVSFFDPETTHGQVSEETVSFKLKAVVAITGAADDPYLTPSLPGVTDQLTIDDWDPPFPFGDEQQRRIRDKDEDYWDQYKTTPKAFISLAAGRRLWGSRFGNTTTLRIAPAEGLTAQSLAEMFQPDPAEVGFRFQPVKLAGLAASVGTTAFSGLFLGFSFFIIVAALMLVALLFRLGIEQRGSEVGIMLAVGLRRRDVRRLLLAEGVLVAAVGSLVGAAVGVGYAWLMLTGLRTLWVEAITTPFLKLHIGPSSLPVGYVSGVIASALAIAWSLWQMRHLAVRQLLSNRGEMPSATGRKPRNSRIVAWVSVLVAAGISLAALGLRGEAQAGAFFGSASLVLLALLAFLWNRLSTGNTGSLIATTGSPVLRLAVRNAARHPSRSTLTIGLVASASFLIVAISAFQLQPPESLLRRDSGTGGYSLVGQSDQPIYFDLATEKGQSELGFSPQQRLQLAGTTTFSLRVRGDEDASCRNLYQVQRPRVLGVSRRQIERGGFAWVATAATTPEQHANPWLLLEEKLPPDSRGRPVIPVVIDQATAIYSLHLSGVGATYELIDDDQSVLAVFQVVGLLKNSILQGVLLVSETAFVDAFPEINGYRFFLVETPPGKLADTEELLESTLGDLGFALQRSDRRLAAFLAVQNTYLSTFQSLGGLGLLLGTFGLATVQLRNVLERRGELALLRAIGLRRRLLARMVLWENIALLVGGLAVGLVAALVAVLPHLLLGGAAIPWIGLGGTLGLVLAVGLIASTAAVRATLATDLLKALRGD